MHRLVPRPAPVLAVALLVAPGPVRAVTRDEVLARAQVWVDLGVPYDQSAWYTEPTTGACCYRTDCSGYVSAVWGLDPPGHTTYSFAGGPWDSGLSYVIDASQLLPGDALNYPGDPDAGTGHIMLYVAGDFWSGWVEVYEEYSWDDPAVRRWRSIDPWTYLPIRYTGIEDCAPAGEVCDGLDNDCDGLVDEEGTAEVCDLADNDCDGLVNEDWVCGVAFEPGLSAFRADQGTHSDLDGDGRADVCARAAAGLACFLTTADGFQELPVLPDLADAEGYVDFENHTTFRTADVDGDGRADACARHPTLGFRCWLSQGDRFGRFVEGPALTDANGWNDYANYGTLRMADLDGDGRTDLCGRSDAGLDCWLSDGASLTTWIEGPRWSDADGWNEASRWSTIRLGDIDGDGLVDACGRGSGGVECWRFDGAAFPTRWDGPPLRDVDGWNLHPYYATLALPDVNGDGRADLCARSAAGMRCYAGTQDGFGPAFTGPDVSDAQGWGVFPYYATLQWADFDGDGRDDLVGRGVAGVYAWRSLGDAFADPIAGPALSDASGWLDESNFLTLQAGDLDGDGRADLCAREDAGLACWRSDGAGWPGAITGPAWSDDLGWAGIAYWSTIRVRGGGPVDPTVGDTGEDGKGGCGCAAARGSGRPTGAPGGSGVMVLAGLAILGARRARNPGRWGLRARIRASGT